MLSNMLKCSKSVSTNLTYLSSNSITSTARTSQSFSYTLPTGENDRYLVVCAYIYSSSATLSGVTVNSTGSTQVIKRDLVDVASVSTGIYIIGPYNSSSQSLTIVVSSVGSAESFGIGLYSIRTVSGAAPTLNSTNSSAGPSVTLTMSTNGIAIATSIVYGIGVDPTWSGTAAPITKDLGMMINANSVWSSSASVKKSTNTGSRTMTSSSTLAMAGASWL